MGRKENFSDKKNGRRKGLNYDEKWQSMASVRFCIQTKRKGIIIHNGHSKGTTMAKWEWCLLK